MLVGISIDPHGDTIDAVTYGGVTLTRYGQVYDSATHASVRGLWPRQSWHTAFATRAQIVGQRRLRRCVAAIAPYETNKRS
jgi:hypothetical protein